MLWRLLGVGCPARVRIKPVPVREVLPEQA